MHHHLPLLLLLTLTLLRLSTAASSSYPPPPFNHSRFTKQRLLQKTTTPGQEQFEITRPLLFSSLTPSCTLPVFSGEFGNTAGFPPSNSAYTPPLGCTWSNAVIHLSASSTGDQYDRIAAVWLSGAEILRTSTAETRGDGVFWNVRKDVTRYSSILRKSNLTLFVMLENIVNDIFTGVYKIDLTFLYYNVPLTLYPPIQKAKVNYPLISLDLNESPADLIIPVSAIGDKGFWFRIESESDEKHKGVTIPLNTYRAVIEVYCSSHGNDEFWYSNPPDEYIPNRGHGSYREVVVTIDDYVVGSVIPFPVIFTGGINPLFWDPVVSIGAFNLPSYEIELTPFLGLLLDGKTHNFGFSVTDGISFWLLDANLHLWVDQNVDKVQARTTRIINPSSSIEREFSFEDGEFEVEGNRHSEFSGWVSSSTGNFTTYVSTKLDFENEIEFSDKGKEKTVNQEVEVTNVVKIHSHTRKLVFCSSVERKYPLKIKSTTKPRSKSDTYLIKTKLEHSYTEEKCVEKFGSKLKNALVNHQKSEGLMFAKDRDVLSGSASTRQRYTIRGSSGCYTRKVSAANGYVKADSMNVLCESTF